MPDAPAAPATGADFVLARVFAAALPRVWAAWTQPELLARWFGPKGVTTTVLQAAVRPGGLLHARMDQPDGGTLWARFLYREVQPPARLVWEHGFADAAAGLARPPFGGAWPLQLLTTVTFAAEGEATRVTLRWSPLAATPEEVQAFRAATASMQGGWGGSFERLDTVLAAPAP